ncbi:hypothetical protein ABEH87_12350 [Erwinia sp. Eh17-17]|uniref:hypothetical protein n=1 Tax=Erwinia sp. Eh17-17 TaxID=3080330 RepID=UPI003208A962
MSLSKKAVNEQDNQLRKTLHRRDNLAVIPFFAIPLGLYLVGGRNLAMLTPLLWVIYSAVYLFLFHQWLRGFSTDELRQLATMGKNYPFRVFCWIVLIGAGLCAIATIVRFFKPDLFL